jgi:hypothetical protein
MGAKSKKVTKTDKTDKKEVILLRQGLGKQGFHLPAGATLGDLLRAAEVNPAIQELFIDGKSIEDALVLQLGTIVWVGPRPGNGAPSGSWRDGVGMFHGDETFREMVEAVEKSREAEKDRS